jgi:hypothetical protein
MMKSFYGGRGGYKDIFILNWIEMDGTLQIHPASGLSKFSQPISLLCINSSGGMYGTVEN